jgi:hypothetical protein
VGGTRGVSSGTHPPVVYCSATNRFDTRSAQMLSDDGDPADARPNARDAKGHEIRPRGQRECLRQCARSRSHPVPGPIVPPW